MYFWPGMFNCNVWFFLLIFQLLAKRIHEFVFWKEANAGIGALAILIRLEFVHFLSNVASDNREEDKDPVNQRKHQNFLLYEDGQNLKQITVPWLNANTCYLRNVWACTLFSLALNSQIIEELNQWLKKGSFKFLGLWLCVPVSEVLGDSL